MNSDKVINIKNIIVLISLLGSIVVRIILNTILRVQSIASISLFLVGLFTLPIAAVGIWKKVNPKITMCFLCLSILVIITVMMMTDSNLANYCIIFYTMFLAVLYEDIRAIIIVGCGDVILLLSFYSKCIKGLFDTEKTYHF